MDENSGSNLQEWLTDFYDQLLSLWNTQVWPVLSIKTTRGTLLYISIYVI